MASLKLLVVFALLGFIFVSFWEMRSILRLYYFTISDRPLRNEHGVEVRCAVKEFGITSTSKVRFHLAPKRFCRSQKLIVVPSSNLTNFRLDKFPHNLLVDQWALSSMPLANIIKIVKDLLNQLLPTLNDLVQDVGSLKILPNFLFSSNWTMWSNSSIKSLQISKQSSTVFSMDSSKCSEMVIPAFSGP